MSSHPCKWLLAAIAAASLLGVANSSQVLLAPSSTPGCGTKHHPLHNLEPVTIDSKGGGGQRSFEVYLPPNYNESQPTGMILSYHGYGQTSAQQAALSRFNDSTINPNMIAVFPQGVELAWQYTPHGVAGVNDKIFTTDLLRHMRDSYCIDDTRIYASGKSDGAGFVDTLACFPEGANFAAFAMASAALYTETENVCAPSRSPLPIMEFHGTNDTIIPYAGNPKRGLPAIPSWLGAWAVRDGCPASQKPFTESDFNNTVHYMSYACDNTIAVQAYELDGQKHWWPSTQWNADNQGHVAPIDASRIMMEFFEFNTKP